MGDNTIIKVEHLSKKFSRSLRDMMVYTPLDVGKGVLGIERKSDRLRNGEFWAVDGVSFELQRGQRLGLIGRNGSGKSTLLKMLNGILLPDAGYIRTRGRVAALIEVGAGFHPMLTGRENIYVNGSIIGMKKDEITKKFDEIVDFAGIGGFLDSPVKFYSSGMYVRLGFSIAVHAAADILLIDEVLAVGDFSFQKKCFDRLESIVESGMTIVFVSHSMASVQRLCPVSIFLDKGRMTYFGDSRDATASYYQSMHDIGVQEQTDRCDGYKILHRRGGSMSVYLDSFSVCDCDGHHVKKIQSGSFLRFDLGIRSKNDADERLPRVAIRVVDPQTEELIANIQTPQKIVSDVKIAGRTTIICTVPVFNLAPGVYRFETKIGGDGEDLHDISVIDECLEVGWTGEIVDNMSYKGKVYLPGEWGVDPTGAGGE